MKRLLQSIRRLLLSIFHFNHKEIEELKHYSWGDEKVGLRKPGGFDKGKAFETFKKNNNLK